MNTESPGIRFECFGGFWIEIEGGKTLGFSTNKSRALLVYLAVEAGRAFRRSHLAGLLWSDVGEEQALHNLRQTLSLLRKAWEELQSDYPLLLTERDTVQFNPQIKLRVDVRAFDDALGEAYRHFQNHRSLARLNVRRLIQALSLFRAPFLDRFELDNSSLFDEWAISVRERTNQAAVEGLALLCEYYERRGEFSPAAATAKRIVELTPWDERAHTRVMRLLAIDQHWSAAQNQYIRLKQYLKRNLDVEPDPETTTLSRQIRSAATANRPFPPHFPLSAHHLPAPVEFVGRIRELDEITQMLADPQIRLITVTGLGGIGKTRLAVEAGRIQVGIFDSGVFFVPMLNLSSYATFLSALAKGMGLPFSESRPPETQILDTLREKRTLLILDNFDHLLEDPQNPNFIIEILDGVPGVKVLVTSRERLSLKEEYRFGLDGLSYPSRDSEKKQSSQDFEAVVLFEKWARKINHGFQLNPENRTPIFKICSLMQGHPLGIELAASLTPDPVWNDLLVEIEKGLHRLESQFSNAPAQHKTLKVVFDASWQRLTAGQQLALCKLSICRGGFTGEAAALIAEVSGTFLADLAGKSLLRQGPDGRFDFHEAIRQYTEEKLTQSGHAEEAQDLLAGTYTQYLKGYAAAGDFANRQAGLNWIDLEFDNLRIAWNRLIETRCAEKITDWVDLLYQFFNIRSRFVEGIAWFQSAIEGLSPFAPADPVYGMLQSRAGSLALRARKDDLALEALTASFENLSHSGNHHELAFCLIGLGGYHLRKKAYREAHRCADESLAYYREANDLSGQSYALYLSGLIFSRLGNYTAAKEALTQSLSLCRQNGDRRRLIAPLNVLGDTACIEGDYNEAEKMFLEGLEISRELNDRFNQAILLNNLATIYQYRKQFAKEETVLLESLEICRDIGDLDGEAIGLNNLGEMAVVQGKYSEALEFSKPALKIALQLQEDWTIIVCLNNIGEAFLGLKDVQNAGPYFKSAALRCMNIEAMDLLARVAVNAAPAFYFNGEKQTAVDLLLAALAHSATEFESRQKAAYWLEKLKEDAPQINDDRFLVETVQKVFGSPTGYPSQVPGVDPPGGF